MKTPKMVVSKTFEFDFSHFLPGYNGKCKNLHGHRGICMIAVEDYINTQTGMVIDFVEMKRIIDKEIMDIMDHNHLNNIIEMPTAENICLWIWNKLIKAGLNNLSYVKFWETPSSCCALTKESMNEYMNQLIYKGNNISSSYDIEEEDDE